MWFCLKWAATTSFGYLHFTLRTGNQNLIHDSHLRCHYINASLLSSFWRKSQRNVERREVVTINVESGFQDMLSQARQCRDVSGIYTEFSPISFLSDNTAYRDTNRRLVTAPKHSQCSLEHGTYSQPEEASLQACQADKRNAKLHINEL